MSSWSIATKRAFSCMVLAILLQAMIFVYTNTDMLHKPRSCIWVRPWAAAHLNSQSWSGELAWRNLSFNRPAQERQSLLEASRQYLDRNYTRQREIMADMWTRVETLDQDETSPSGGRRADSDSGAVPVPASASTAAQAGLLRVFLTLNLCPILDTVLCDKRSLSAHMFGMRSSTSSLLHPSTTLWQVPPFISASAKEGLHKLPIFPLQKTYFLKDPSLNLGKGITVLPKHFDDLDSVLAKLQQGFLLQEGVDDPVLLGGYKFTFRLYLFVQQQGEGQGEGEQQGKGENRAPVLFLSTNGNTAASHTVYHQETPASSPASSSGVSSASGESGAIEGEARARQVTNQFTQVDVKQCGRETETDSDRGRDRGSGSTDGKDSGDRQGCCPDHAALPPEHRLWQHTLAMLEQQYGSDVMDRTALRDDIKRIIIAAVKPALLTLFPPASEQTEVSRVLSNSSLPAGNSVHDICQALYGVDFILHHHHTNDRHGGSNNNNNAVGVQLLEVQMEPNTRVKCPADAALYADLAAGVWQIVARGRPDDDQIFEKLDFDSPDTTE